MSICWQEHNREVECKVYTSCFITHFSSNKWFLRCFRPRRTHCRDQEKPNRMWHSANSFSAESLRLRTAVHQTIPHLLLFLGTDLMAVF